ncbi:MAG TPA: ferredoxin, partial [Candidatus Copromorpha excrementigallinarum]|nr:ferredoxin [Candidatus Copromorpha excrementigallinarum]
TGGESIALETEKFIAVDGVDEAVEIFESLEDEKFGDIEYIEAAACTGGCFGGSLTVENSYSAKSNIKVIVDEAKEKYGYDIINIPENYRELKRDMKLEYNPVLQLDSDLGIAIKKMEEMGRILRKLPGLDCGVCGAPTCRAFAEDVVRGIAPEESCVIMERPGIK